MTGLGDYWDHYVLTYIYPNEVAVSVCHTQFNKGWWDVCERFFGSKGVSESHYSYPVRIVGDEPWDAGLGEPPKGAAGEFSRTGAFHGALDQADAEKQKAFIESITSGKFINEAAAGAESALSAMLGRTAAYAGREITWDEMLKLDEAWDAALDLNQFA